MMAGTLVSRAFGLVRQAAFNNLFPDAVKDAFNVAFRVPNLFREVLAEGAVTNALIPSLKELPQDVRPAFVRRFFALLLGLDLVVVGLILLFAPLFAELLIASGSSLDRALVVRLIRLLSPFLLAVSLAAFFSALHQEKERFFWPAFAPVAFNLVAILLMLLFPDRAEPLALAFVLGGFAQAAASAVGLKGLGLEFQLDARVLRALSLMVPFLFTTSTRQVVNVVLTALLTAYPRAAVTGFYNAEMVYLMVLGLFSVSPAMALFPRLAGAGAGFGRLLVEALERVGTVLAGLSALMLALAPWAIGVLFAWSPAFTPANFRFSSEALSALALAVFPWGVYALLVRGLYARQRIWAAVRVSVAVFLLNALLYYLLAPRGMFVLNLATVAAGWVGVGLLLALLKEAGVGAVLWPWGQALFAAFVAGLAARLTADVAGPPGGAIESLWPLLSGGLVGGLVFMGLAEGFGLKLGLRR